MRHYVTCSWRRIVTVLLIVVASATDNQVDASDVQGWQPLAYSIDARFDTTSGAVETRANITLKDRVEGAGGKALPIVFFLHDGLRVSGIEVDGRRVRFEQSVVDYAYNYTTRANRVVISAEEIGGLGKQIRVSYAGTFRPSSARSPSDYMRVDSDGVLLRAYGYSLWFPVFLEAGKDSYAVNFADLSIDVSDDLTTVFAGKKIDERRKGDRNVSTWHADNLDLFAAQLTARKFKTLSHKGASVYYEDQNDSLDAARCILGFVERLNELYSKHYGQRDQNEQIHVMEMPKYGDIASGNVVGIAGETWREFDRDPYAKRTLAHELVHRFVHMQTPRSDPLYALMIEGFPSYLHLPVLAETEGEFYYNDLLDKVQQRYLTQRQTGKDRRGNALPIEKPLYEIKPDEVGEYKDRFVLADRALLFFDYLRRKNGPQRFFVFTRDLFSGTELSHSTFEAIVQRHFGIAVNDLNVWLDSNDYPQPYRRPGNSSH